MVQGPKAGDTVILLNVPAGLLDGLPQADQQAIIAVVGKPVLLVGYDEDGRAELEFDEGSVPYEHRQTIWVAPEYIRASLGP